MSRLDDLVARCEAATPGKWGARWHDPKGEAAHFTASLAIATAEDRDGSTANTAYQVRTEPEQESEWVNIGYIGNGPCSHDNAVFIAHARTDLPALAADFRTVAEALRAAVNSYEAERPGYWIETAALDVVDRWLWEGT